MEEKLPRKTEKPWGYELLFAHTPRYAGKVISVNKGHRLSLQYHRQKDEVIYIYSGKAQIDTGENEQQMTPNILGPGQCVHVTTNTRHRFKALEDTIFFEVSTPELDDVVRLSDDYGRAGK